MEPASASRGAAGGPSPWGVNDYLLGGWRNFGADRTLGAQIARVAPDAAATAYENRAALGRIVRYLLSVGIRQYIDLGAGIVTLGSVHEVALAVEPAARVVYLDTDPVALAHSRALLAGVPQASVVAADLRRPDEVLAHPKLQGHIDLSMPVGLLAMSVLHFYPDPAAIVAGYLAKMAAGSYLALSHLSVEGMSPGSDEALELYSSALGPLYPRSRQEITALFGSLRLVPPGVVYVTQWRPDGSGAPRVPLLCGVGRRE